MTDELLLLPFDHRHTFITDLLGLSHADKSEQINSVRELKQIIYEGFQWVREQQEEKNPFGILVDEEFGKEIILDAKSKGIITAVAVEKSGLDVFDFEYGDQFREHITAIDPTYVKVLVRYNPKNTDVNDTQLNRLAKLSQFCIETGRKLLFELLVPATTADLRQAGTPASYYTTLRIEHTVEALQEIQCVVHADIWKLEGCENDDWPKILEAVSEPAKIIVLGRGADDNQVIRWLVAGSKYNRVIGFAVGRTVFMESLRLFVGHRLDRKETIEAIGKEFMKFSKFWLDERKK